MSMAQSTGSLPDDLAASFETLVTVVREWREARRLTTTAGVKPALQMATGGAFDQSSFGFASFREYLNAATAAGVVVLHQLPTKHWLVLLPGETVESVIAAAASSAHPSAHGASAATPPGPANGASDGQRLWPAIWNGFVDWDQSHRRLWDRGSRRAFSYPVDGEGRPAWESEPERFAEIEPADQGVQIQWMRAWAESLPTQLSQAVLASLAHDALAGEYKRQLDRLGLGAEWRAELQQRVAEHAVAWADAHHVDFRDLFDTRLGSSTPTLRTNRRSSPTNTARQSTTPVGSITGVDHASLLRQRLHSVIDKMSFAELAELRVPAHHLIND